MIIESRFVVSFFIVLSLCLDGSVSQSGANELFDRTLLLNSSLREERLDAGVCEGETDDNNGEEWDLCFRSDESLPKNSHCMCDDQCSDYKDCCADRLSHSGVIDFDLSVPDSCVELYSGGRLWTSVYGIDRCDDHWLQSHQLDRTSEAIYQKCELSAKEFESADEEYSYLQDISVMSDTTKTMYKNLFCAICNNDSDNLKTWNTSVECKGHLPEELLQQNNRNILPENYDKNKKEWKVLFRTNDSVVCSLVVHQFKDKDFISDHNLRKCKKTVDKCPDKYSNVSVSDKCQSYASYVFADDIAYKNYHCALCHGVDLSYVSCFANRTFTPYRDWSESNLWFPLLLDFGSGDGNLVGDRTVHSCNASGQLYDPLYKKCISVCVNKTCVNRTVAADICSAEAPLDVKKLFYQIILSELSLYLSIICLAIHLIIYAILPKLRNLPGKNLMSLSVALLLGHLSFTIGAHLEANRKIFCVLTAITSHYSYLAAFFWMSVMAYDICKTFRRTSRRSKDSKRYKFLKYSLYGWLSPAIVVMISTAFDIGLDGSPFQPLYGCRVCWIAHKKALLVFFALPVAVIVCVNIFLFGLTAIGLMRTERQTKILNKKSEKVRYYLYIKLTFIMGLTWIFGFAATLTGWQHLWYPFIVFNCLQGAVIFIAFTCKSKVCKLLSERLGCGKGYDRSRSNSGVIRSGTASSSLVTSTLMPSSPDSNITKIVFSK